jgi:hypothetical protein
MLEFPFDGRGRAQDRRIPRRAPRRKAARGPCRDGSVLCPAHEFDPRTAEEPGEFVPLNDRGTVRAWTWVPSQPDDVLPHGWMGLCGGLCSSALAVAWLAGSEPSPGVTVCKSCDGRVSVALCGWFRGWCRAIG